MADKAKTGGSIIGVIFLALGVLKFLQGENWIVWIILGFLFGGLGFFAGKKGAGES